jgi:hypothetical protein
LRPALSRETALLREFQRRYHHHGVNLPSEASTLEWLALMQHHGAPTRLLDWTYSFYVAAYFACEHALNSTADAALWVLNATWATEASAQRFDAAKGGYAGYVRKKLPHSETERSFDAAFRAPDTPACVCPASPFRLNERLTIQKGTFTVIGDVTRSTEDNVCALGNLNDIMRVTKLTIPRDVVARMLRDLFNMNIGRATLFPGLDGFASSLAINVPWSE